MSQHVIESDKIRWVFGWDQAYRSFFLTKFDKTRYDGVSVPAIDVGKRPREIPTPEGLVTLAAMVGLEISHELLLELGREQNMEGNSYYVLHWPGEFIRGFKTDSLSQAELLKDALTGARSGEELQIRWMRRNE